MLNEHQTRAEIDKATIAVVNFQPMDCADGKTRNPEELTEYVAKISKPYLTGRGGAENLTNRFNQAVVSTNSKKMTKIL